MTCEHQITKQKTCKQNNKQKRMNEYTNDNETEKKNDTHTHTHNDNKTEQARIV